MNFKLPVWLRPEITLIVVAVVMLFSGINRYELRDSTEPREAGVAADMLQQHQYIVPTLNGEAFLEKPPLSYWLQAACIKTFGYHAFAPRIPSVLAGISIICLFIFFFRKTDDSKLFMFSASLLLITMASFWFNTREAGQDILLTLGVSLTLLAFYFTREFQPRLNWLLFSLGISIATLTKGVIGLAVPGVTIFVFLLLETMYFDKKIILSNWLYPALFTLLGLVPILLWLCALYNSQGIAAVKEILWTNSFGRFVGEYSRGSHAEPFYYYLTKIPETFQPWTILFYLAFWGLAKTIIHNKKNLLFFCWVVAPFILLSLSAGKRPPYLLMIYPAAAAIIASYISTIAQSALNAAHEKKFKIIAVIQGVLFLILSLFIVAKLFKTHSPIVAVLTACALSFLLLLLVRSIKQLDIFKFSSASVGILAIVYLTQSSFVMAYEDTKESAKSLLSTLNNYSTSEHNIALYKPSERVSGAATFYLQHRIPALSNEQELLQAINANAFVLVSSEENLDLKEYRVVDQLKYAKQMYFIIALK